MRSAGRLISSLVVGAAALRATWLTWQYYFAGGPRYRVESAMMLLALAGGIVMWLRRDPAPRDDDSPAIVPRGALPLLIAGSVVLYVRAIGLGLLSDDFPLRAVAESGELGSDGGFFRPLPLLLWRGVLAVVDAPALLHLINIVIHGANAYLVAVLGSAMGMRREHALGAALLFLAFPALPEAVAWTAGIQDVLMTTMALSAVIVAGRKPAGWRRIAAVCVLLVLGLGAKETAICIPVLVTICWLTPARLRQDWRLYVAMAAVTTAYLAIRLPMGIASDYLAAPSRYLFKQLIVGAFGTLAVPWRDPASGLDRAVAFSAVVLLVLLLVHAFLTWRRGDRRLQRDVRLALWVVASIAPVFTYFFVSPTLEGSRYVYLAAGAWALVVVDLLASIVERTGWPAPVFAAAAAGIVLVFGLSIQRELSVWQQAADLRDRVLAAAQSALAESPCERPAFSNPPDSVAGAYVFRNGFPEALGTRSGAAGPPPECTFTWIDGRFDLTR